MIAPAFQRPCLRLLLFRRRAGRCVFRPEGGAASGDSLAAESEEASLPPTASPYDALPPAVRDAMDKPFTGDLDETGETSRNPCGRHVQPHALLHR